MPTPRSSPGGSSFARSVARLAAGTGLAQIIGLAATPVITRLYSPEAYGNAAVFASITSTFGVIACLRYELAIVLPRDDRDAASLLALSLMLAATVSLSLVVVTVLFGTQISVATRLPLLLVWLTPIAVLVEGTVSALSYWHTREKEYGRISVSRVSGRASTTAGVLISGFAGYATSSAMVIASLGGQLVSAIVLSWRLLSTQAHRLLEQPLMRSVRDAGARYDRFPKYNMWSILLGVSAWQLPIVLLAAFYPATIVGLYALGFRILQLPMNLIGEAIGQVFFREAAEAHDQGLLRSLVSGLASKIIVCSLLPITILGVVAADLFELFFGAPWREAGVYTQILSVWAFFWFLSVPFTRLFIVLDRQRLQLKWNVINFLVRVSTVLVGGIYLDARQTIALLSISGTVLYATKILITLQLAGAIRETFSTSVALAVGTSAGAGAALLLVEHLTGNPAAVLATGCILLLLYCPAVLAHYHTSSRLTEN